MSLSSRDLVCLSSIVDDDALLTFVADSVLYHELLHKNHVVEIRGKGRYALTSAFKADEHRHPRLQQAKRYLALIAKELSAKEAAAASSASP